VSGFELVCLDMAGTTVRDDGLVLEAFTRSVAEFEGDPSRQEEMVEYARSTMGQSKIEVFTSLFGDAGASANAAFERHVAELATSRGVEEIAGARDAIESLRRRGLKVGLTTGFSPATRDALLRQLGWSDLFDLVLSPADAGRGRPFPDMLLTCVIRLGASSVAKLVAVGDTAADMAAAGAAGAGLSVGVLSGADGADALRASGADVVIPTVAGLAEIVAASEM
jgi:phosphonatase-like hydrolase